MSLVEEFLRTREEQERARDRQQKSRPYDMPRREARAANERAATLERFNKRQAVNDAASIASVANGGRIVDARTGRPSTLTRTPEELAQQERAARFLPRVGRGVTFVPEAVGRSSLTGNPAMRQEIERARRQDYTEVNGSYDIDPETGEGVSTLPVINATAPRPKPSLGRTLRNTAIAVRHEMPAAVGEFAMGLPRMIAQPFIDAPLGFEEAGAHLERGDREGAVAPALRGAENTIYAGMNAELGVLGVSALRGAATRAVTRPRAPVEAPPAPQAAAVVDDAARAGNAPQGAPFNPVEANVQPSRGPNETGGVGARAEDEIGQYRRVHQEGSVDYSVPIEGTDHRIHVDISPPGPLGGPKSVTFSTTPGTPPEAAARVMRTAERAVKDDMNQRGPFEMWRPGSGYTFTGSSNEAGMASPRALRPTRTENARDAIYRKMADRNKHPDYTTSVDTDGWIRLNRKFPLRHEAGLLAGLAAGSAADDAEAQAIHRDGAIIPPGPLDTPAPHQGLSVPAMGLGALAAITMRGGARAALAPRIARAERQLAEAPMGRGGRVPMTVPRMRDATAPAAAEVRAAADAIRVENPRLSQRAITRRAKEQVGAQTPSQFEQRAIQLAGERRLRDQVATGSAMVGGASGAYAGALMDPNVPEEQRLMYALGGAGVAGIGSSAANEIVPWARNAAARAKELVFVRQPTPQEIARAGSRHANMGRVTNDPGSMRRADPLLEADQVRPLRAPVLERSWKNKEATWRTGAAETPPPRSLPRPVSPQEVNARVRARQAAEEGADGPWPSYAYAPKDDGPIPRVQYPYQKYQEPDWWSREPAWRKRIREEGGAPVLPPAAPAIPRKPRTGLSPTSLRARIGNAETVQGVPGQAAAAGHALPQGKSAAETMRNIKAMAQKDAAFRSWLNRTFPAIALAAGLGASGVAIDGRNDQY